LLDQIHNLLPLHLGEIQNPVAQTMRDARVKAAAHAAANAGWGALYKSNAVAPPAYLESACGFNNP
jgi:hypothetical protein